jgi:prefoldin alpha subunit
MEQQEYFMRINMMGQEAERIEQQIQMIDQHLSELGAVNESILAIKNSDKNKEILANLGKGIFVKADLREKNLFVNVGRDVLIKKTPDETIKVIQGETTKLMEGKELLIEKIQGIQESMKSMMEEMQNQAGNEQHGHSCGNEECQCETPCEDCECEHEHKKEKKNKK